MKHCGQDLRCIWNRTNSETIKCVTKWTETDTGTVCVRFSDLEQLYVNYKLVHESTWWRFYLTYGRYWTGTVSMLYCMQVI